MPIEEPSGLKPWQIGLIALAALVVLGLVVRKIKRAKKRKLELEDLDE
jgi:hypothetical protein